MGTLKETIENNAKLKQGGGLYETSQEELGTLSSAVGRASNPVSPLGAKLLGANADQTKMAGSSANKAASLNASVSGDLSLRDTVRQSQASTAMTAEEEEKKRKEGLLSGLKGSLDTRVQEIAAKKLGGAVDAAGNPMPVAAPKANIEKVKTLFPTLDPAKHGAVTASIDKLLTNPSDLESAKNVAESLGMDVSSLSADQLISKVKETLDSEKDAITESAEGLDTAVSMSDVFSTPEAIQALGDPSAIADALGLSPADFEKLDVPKLKAKMEELGLKDFNEVAELQRKSADPYTSASEKAAILKELRRLGASGIRGTEQEYTKLQEEVNSAETVEIGNRSFTTEELLNDATISGLISDYLTDPEAAKELAGTPLAAFIERNKNALAEASSNLSGAAKAFADVNSANRELGKTADGSPIDPAIMKAIFPSYGALGSSKLDPNSSPEFMKFKALEPAVQNSVVKALGKDASPELIKAVMGADPNQLTMLNNAGGISSWVSFRKNYERAMNQDPELAVNTLLGQNPEKFKEAMAEYRAAQAAGVLRPGFSIPLAELIDQNRDGVMDDPKVLKAALLQHYQSSRVPVDMESIPRPGDDLAKLSEITTNASDVYSTVKNYIRDGNVSDSDVAGLVSSNTPNDMLEKVMKLPSTTTSAKQAITRELGKRSLSELEGNLAKDIPQSAQALAAIRSFDISAAAAVAPAVTSMVGYLQNRMNVGSEHDKAAARRTVQQISATMGMFLNPEGQKKFSDALLSGMSYDAAKASVAKYAKGRI